MVDVVGVVERRLTGEVELLVDLERVDANAFVEASELVAIQYGAFINTLIKFLIVAFVVFLMVRLINKLRRDQAAEPEAAPAAPTPTEALLAEIRDELKARPKA